MPNQASLSHSCPSSLTCDRGLVGHDYFDFDFDEVTRPLPAELLESWRAACPHSDVEWLGVQEDTDDDGNPAPLALANCKCCRTTVARQATDEDLHREQVRQLMLAVRSGAVTVELGGAVSL